MVFISGDSYDCILKLSGDFLSDNLKLLFCDSCGAVVYETGTGHDNFVKTSDLTYMLKLSPETTSKFNGRIVVSAVTYSDDRSVIKSSNNKIMLNFRKDNTNKRV